MLPGLLESPACAATAMLYDWDDGFRSRVVMARHGFGRGEYRYFAYPLPRTVEDLRNGLYPHLAPIANGWQARLGQEAVVFPSHHGGFVGGGPENPYAGKPVEFGDTLRRVLGEG